MSLNFLVYNEQADAHAADIFSLTTTPDFIVSTSSDGTVKFWDITTNAAIRTIDAAFASGGKCITSAGSLLIGLGFAGDLKVLPLSDTDAVLDLHDDKESGGDACDWCVAASPDATTVAATTSTGHLNVYDVASKTRVAHLATRDKFGMAIDYAASNRMIATGHIDGGVFLFDTQSGKLTHSLSLHDTIRGVAFSPNSEILACAGDAGLLWCHDTKTGEQIGLITAHTSPITTLAWNGSGELILTGSMDGKLKLWHVLRKECVGTFTENVGHKIWSVKWCKMGPNKLEGFVVGGGEKLLRFYLPTST